MSPEFLTERGRLGAFAKVDGKDAAGRRALTAAAVAKTHQQLLDAVDAEAAERGETLDAAEREYRVTVKIKRRMSELGLASARKRKAEADARKAAERDAELAELAALEADAL